YSAKGIALVLVCMSQPLKLGVAGLGTVGAGLVQLLHEHGARMATALGRSVEIVGVSARQRQKNRGLALEGIAFFEAAERLAGEPGIEVFVELIGGEEGVGRGAGQAALKAAKHAVTRNKELLAS